jgi:hypothetical protein
MWRRGYGSFAVLTLIALVPAFMTCELSAKWPGTNTSAENYAAPAWVSIRGNVRATNGIPVCALALANGQYMFSCDGNGTYSLNVPLDDQGQVTLFAFADGFAPYRITADPTNLPAVVQTQTADPGSPLIAMTRSMECAGNNWVRLSGEIESFEGDPLCALVLANGQHMFSCGASQGRYDLTVPVDENGNITLFGFADGFQPYSETSMAPQCGDPNAPSCVDISGDWFAEETVTVTCSILGETETETQDGSGWTYVSQNGCSISYPAIGADSIGVDITRSGAVDGNRVTVSGPLVYALEPGVSVSFSQNLATAGGTATSNEINFTGSGSASGTADGYSFNCTGTSTARLTR